MTAATKAAPAPAASKTAGTVLVLRTCASDGGSHNGFKHPLEIGATVTAPDWNSRVECGGGIHGLEYGLGDYGLLRLDDSTALWQIYEVEDAPDNLVRFPDGSKCKFRTGRLVYVQAGQARGLVGATAYIRLNSKAWEGVGEAHTAGDRAPASTAGYLAPASTAGYLAPASTAGDLAPASTAGYLAPASTAGYLAPASTAGDRAPASTAGYLAPASTAGDRAPASALGKQAIAACLGFNSRAQAGEDGCVIVAWWEGTYPKGRPRVTVGYVGENGIKASTWYAADAQGQLVEKPDSGVNE